MRWNFLQGSEQQLKAREMILEMREAAVAAKEKELGIDGPSEQAVPAAPEPASTSAALDAENSHPRYAECQRVFGTQAITSIHHPAGCCKDKPFLCLQGWQWCCTHAAGHRC